VAHKVLVVDVDREALAAMCAVLAEGDYLVTRATSFTEARRQLVVVKPDALITAIRLGGINGLHLVIRGRSTFPEIVAIVTHPGPDALLQADIAGQHAVWMASPVDSALLRDLLDRMLRAQRVRPGATMPRRWVRRRVASHIDATLGAAHGIVVDVSYGGLRVRLSEPLGETLGERQQLALPLAGVAVPARSVWSRSAGAEGPWWYGLEVDDSDALSAQAWRAFVDAASEQISI